MSASTRTKSQWQPEDALAFLAGDMPAERATEFKSALENGGVPEQWMQHAQSLRALCSRAQSDAQHIAELLPYPHDVFAPSRPASRSLSAPRWALPSLALALVAIATLAGVWLWPQAPAPSHAARSVFTQGATTQPPHTSSLNETTLNPRGRTPTARPVEVSGPIELTGGATISASPGAKWWVQDRDIHNSIVHLEHGRAQFEVPPRPPGATFTVLAGPISISVIGTAFEVERNADSIVVQVSKGLVRVKGPQYTTNWLGAGESRSWPLAQRTTASSSSDNEIPLPRAKAPQPQPAAMPTRTATRKPESEHRGALPPDPPAQSTAPKLSTFNAPTAAESISSAQIPIGSTGPSKAPPAASDANQLEVQVDVSEPEARENLKKLTARIARGEYSKGLRELEPWLKRHPQHPNAPDALYLRGYCLFKQGRRDEAAALWRTLELRHGPSPWLATVRDWTDPSPPSADRLR